MARRPDPPASARPRPAGGRALRGGGRASAGRAASAAFWSAPVDALLFGLSTAAGGLSSAAAARRLDEYGPNRLARGREQATPALILAQFRSPITLLLVAAAVLALVVGETTEGLTILGIVVVSAVLGFWQERGAAGAMQKLLSLVQVQATVLRDGGERSCPVAELVPGDVVRLAAGDSVPGDGRLLAAAGLFVDEAALTGESFPVEKRVGDVAADAPLTERDNAVFMGTHVVSGTGSAVIVTTGPRTIVGGLAAALRHAPPENDFERGIRRFGYLLLEVTLVLVLFILSVNVALGRGALDSLLFALALAVGLTPQLLPAIVSVTLAHGARVLARHQVIVKRLASIENFGSMDVLCADKTGTVTEGVTRVEGGLSCDGASSRRVVELAVANAVFQAGSANPIDVALRALADQRAGAWTRVGELPYDFVRKRVSVLLDGPDGRMLVTKGALREVLAICDRAELGDGRVVPLAQVREDVERRFASLSAAGRRCLGVALRPLPRVTVPGPADERDMLLVGLLVLEDPVRDGVVENLQRLADLGIALKLVTGDNVHVARQVALEVGLPVDRLLTGGDLRRMSEAALVRRAGEAAVFAEVEPYQKERLILALKRAGHSVGFLGDGVNDAAALHAADVGISVDTAVDATKQAADIVLLKKDLGVLADGVAEGRRALGNTLKYIFITISANFGNMFSMAAASLFAPFLPLLPQQILLINVLSDLPAMAIATDRLDPELLNRPRRWDVHFIRNFMVTFGFLSSSFDFITFGTLLWLSLPVAQFRTGWFLESVLSELLVLLVIRTRRPFFRSALSRPLLTATLAVAAFTVVLPFLPAGGVLGLAPITGGVAGLLAAIVVAYILVSEATKRLFFRLVGAH